ncbi:threonine synthase [Deinococcus metallilatus]|uniref:Threonine synthase n=1 Tax=Deinococcus metallilatus TaxID=1211322 RepID=A0AAJ5F9Y3_9DEIO|nr:threonine synthase [Deinococcus metallilatus]MBB5294375.1 threonine synthase [Deinococcus metallilatus]QBY10131.1 threonine synthase [Deinococcus metallilatus]RXJ13857.1 threonine synthase [Deinococcus metallilatus]TLK29823.1 threonine synthase [Deinococcus metallilatus]GMA15591.1 threonine synthase [Deinococcus metallilatus]
MPGLIERYREYLPVTDRTPALSLHEGGTPLIPAPKLSARLGVELYLKYEGLNPTGSFKDRGMVMAVAKAVEDGADTIICASTGNTSAAAAAYAARSGLKCIVLIPDGNIALGKLAQAMAYGAQIVAINGNFDAALGLVRRISAEHPIALVNSVNPYRLQGQKTGAFEIVDVLGRAPDILAIPVGNAGNISAYWMGFREYQQAGKNSSLPRMWGFQAEGAAPFVRNAIVDEPQTLATAIRIGNPASADLARAAVRESGGLFDMADDDEIMHAYNLIAQEGVFCEPASATPVAGLLKLHAAGKLLPGQTVVAVLTGNGLKDPDAALRAVEAPKAVEASMERVLESIL